MQAFLNSLDFCSLHFCIPYLSLPCISYSKLELRRSSYRDSFETLARGLLALGAQHQDNSFESTKPVTRRLIILVCDKLVYRKHSIISFPSREVRAICLIGYYITSWYLVFVGARDILDSTNRRVSSAPWTENLKQQIPSNDHLPIIVLLTQHHHRRLRCSIWASKSIASDVVAVDNRLQIAAVRCNLFIKSVDYVPMGAFSIRGYGIGDWGHCLYRRVSRYRRSRRYWPCNARYGVVYEKLNESPSSLNLRSAASLL